MRKLRSPNWRNSNQSSIMIKIFFMLCFVFLLCPCYFQGQLQQAYFLRASLPTQLYSFFSPNVFFIIISSFSGGRDGRSPLHASYLFISFIPSCPLTCFPNCSFFFLYTTCICICIHTNITICKCTYPKFHLNN